jgi:DinB superfamily
VATQQQVDDLIARLARTPERIAEAVAGRTEAVLRAAPAAGEWSAADILAHLRAADAILAYRVYAMLVRDDPPLAAYDERRWAEVARYAEADVHLSAALFAARRSELVRMLLGTSPDEWERTGTHEQRGRITVLDQVTTLVEHEEEHLPQFAAATS